MNFVFIFECLAKIVAQTLRVYLSSNWSRLDALIVTTAILDMALNALLDGNVAALAPLTALTDIDLEAMTAIGGDIGALSALSPHAPRDAF